MPAFGDFSREGNNMDTNIYKHESTDYRIGITQFYVCRGPGVLFKVLAVCPSQEAADAAYRLLSMKSV